MEMAQTGYVDKLSTGSLCHFIIERCLLQMLLEEIEDSQVLVVP